MSGDGSSDVIVVWWTGRRCFVSCSGSGWLCGSTFDVRTDPEDPATSVVERRVPWKEQTASAPPGGRAAEFWVRADVPLGTPATVVEYCGIGGPGGDITARQSTVVGS